MEDPSDRRQGSWRLGAPARREGPPAGERFTVQGPPGPAPGHLPADAPAATPWPAVRPPQEHDPFWGEAVARIPSVPERRFWDRGRPQGKPPFLLWSGAVPVRFAAVLLGLGFFSVFIWQVVSLGLISSLVVAFPRFFDVLFTLLPWLLLFLASLWIYVLILGAPVFEEFFKFGLALFLTAFLAARSREGRLAVGAVRAVAGLAVGAAFGIMEHHLGYSHEPTIVYAGRVAFHGGAAALSAVVYTLLEPLADVRARWFAVLPSVLLHWLNNFTAAPVSITVGLLGLGEGVAYAWSGLITLTVWVLVIGMPWLGRPVRRLVARVTARRLARLPPHWRSWVERRAAAHEAPPSTVPPRP